MTSKFLAWLGDSNRPLHYLAGAILAAVLGIVPVIVAALSLEYKDWCWNGCKWPLKAVNGFDWLDIAATLLGGVVGCLCGYMLFSLLSIPYSFLTGVV